MKKLLLSLAFVCSFAHAWEPTKNVTAYVGNAPGSGPETVFRKLAEIVNKQNPNFVYVIQNIPGADTVIANNRFVDAPADGYTINLVSHMSSYVTNDVWEKDIKKYNYNNFTDVLTMGKSPLVLVASSYSTIKTPQEFIKYISTTNKPVSIAVGNGAHRVAFEYLMLKGRGNDLVKPIRFNGPAQAVLSVAQYDGKLGTEFGIMPIAIAKSLIDSGKVIPIGLTGTRKMEQFPKVPLLNEVTPGINIYGAWSIQLPQHTDKEVVDWYQRSFSQAIRSNEYKEWADNQVIFIEDSELNPQGLKKSIEDLRTTFLPLVKNIKMN